MSVVRFAVPALAALSLAGCAPNLVPPNASAPAPLPAPQASRAPLEPVSVLPLGPMRGARPITPPLPPALALAPAPKAVNARASLLRLGPPVASLGITEAEARSALDAFRRSCPALTRRTDTSGLTLPADWSSACAAASAWSGEAGPFFARSFEAVVVGDGAAFATGYYEPEIAGSRTRGPGYSVPIYARPADLVEADLGLFADDLKGRRIRGKVTGGKFGLYPDRAAIDAGALAGRGLEIAWAADPIEFFFLQIQGSGLLRLPDNRLMRIGYDTQNGRDYVGIGKLLRDRGLLAPGQSSMQGLKGWLRANPQEATAILHENKSFVFFRELGGPGPLGALGLPVTGRMSVAADPAFVPLGAPVFLLLDRPEASGLWVAQDTGGAIKGSNRFDTYWGTGAAAAYTAGGMSGRGTAWLLLPIGTLARLTGAGGSGTAGMLGAGDGGQTPQR